MTKRLLELNDPPRLEPKTKETWVGTRSLGDLVSELQNQIQDLKARISGLTAYKTWLTDQFTWDQYQENLLAQAEQIADISDREDKVDETTQFLQNTFSSFDDYRGDPGSNTRTFAQDTYDQYRDFLISNGASELNSDEHIQFLESIFSANATAASETATHDSWDGLEEELKAKGVSDSDAEEAVSLLQNVFPSVAEMDQQVIVSDDWADFENYLTNNGLSSSDASFVVGVLKDAYGSTLDKGTKDAFSDFDTLDDFEQWLIDQGFASDEAAEIVNTLKEENVSIQELREQIINKGLDGVLELVEEESGPGGAGLYVNDSSVVIKGSTITFEEIDESSDDSDSGTNISWSDVLASPPSGSTATQFSVSATVSNSGSDAQTVNAQFRIDGRVENSKTVSVPANSDRTVIFKTSFDETGFYSVGISKAGGASVVVSRDSGF